ncbi:MAG: prepilin-type N-terminal cleavage/methylation domain-containing protein [Methylococcales bacterium]|nr:prepilin-type N-terminal cleavage/methylation domain-containing protein [Methylococcales bacterium]
MNKSHGFTLIEVLIAMTMLSLMVVLLFSSLTIGAKSWEQGEKKIADVNEIAVVQQFFSHHLAHATPQWNDFNPEKERVFSFQGKKQSLQFVAAFPASAERAGLQLFNLELRKKDKQRFVDVTLTPFFPLSEGEEWFEDSVELVRGVENFELSYFGLNDETGEYGWQSEWLNKEQQPRLVKILLELDDGRYLPEIIVALNVDSSYSNADLESVPVEEVTDATQ